jgi:hypothetical protein
MAISKKVLFYGIEISKENVDSTDSQIHPFRDYCGSYFVRNQKGSSNLIEASKLGLPAYEIYSTGPVGPDGGRQSDGMWWYPTRGKRDPTLPDGLVDRIERNPGGEYHTEITAIPTGHAHAKHTTSTGIVNYALPGEEDPGFFKLELRVIGSSPTAKHAGDRLKYVLNNFGLSTMPPSFVDYTFEAKTAFSVKELNMLNMSDNNAPYYYKIKPEYSFLMREYERTSKKSYINENLLPNVYAFLSEARSQARSTITNGVPLFENIPQPGEPPPDDAPAAVKPWWSTTLYNQLITLAGSIEGVFKDVLYEGKEDGVPVNDPRYKNTKVGEADEGQYYKKWALAWTGEEDPPRAPDAYLVGDGVSVSPAEQLFPEGVVPNPSPTHAGNVAYLIKRFDNSVFETRNLGSLMKEATDKRNLFPMYTHISFPTPEDTPVGAILSQRGRQALFLESLYTTDTSFTPRKTPMNYVQRTQVGSESKIDSSYTLGDTPYYLNKDFNPSGILKDLFDPAILQRNTEEGGWMRYQAQDAAPDSQPGWGRIPLVVDSLAIKSQIETRYEVNRRSFFDIMRCKPAKTEVLAYKICKYEHGSNLQISEVYIPNDNSEELNVINYIDTQVKYNKRYDYKIKQVVLVYGASVTFHEPAQMFRDARMYGLWETAIGFAPRGRGYGGYARIDAKVQPYYKIVEVPLEGGNPAFTTTIRVEDDPPAPPELTFIPFKGNDRKILININNAFNEYWQRPVIVENSDIDLFEEILIAQGNEDRIDTDEKKGKVRFSGDDLAHEFQIYRLSEQPYTFEDFGGQQISQSPISTTVDGHRGDSAGVVDVIEPNKKYYYIGRTVDYHMKVSNPTAIYEVEMISNDGIIFPSIKVVDLAVRGHQKKLARDMRRYIHIEPGIAHQILSKKFGATEKGATAPNPTTGDMGEVTPSIWGTDSNRTGFKVRLTSRSTGRKVDLNLVLNMKYEQNE